MAEAGSLLFAIAAIVAGAGFFRLVFSKLGLPSVAGEILFGIALGPSLLGWAWPDMAAIFTGPTQEVLKGIAWIGLVLFVLQVGLETQWPANAARTAARTAAGGLVIPLAAGAALALTAPQWFFTTPSLKGVLMVGIALTVSALPVLARILSDLRLQDRPLGAIAIAAATLDDVIGWVLLGLISVAGTGDAVLGFAAGVALALLVGTLAIVGERRIAGQLDALTQPSQPLFVIVLVLAFASAAFTDLVGLSAVLGPLGVGLLLARHHVLRNDLLNRLGHVTRLVLLPVFFATSGLAVDLRDVGGGLVAILVVLFVATAAKVLGSAAGARSAGMPWREGFGLGFLLNARGAVGLVVLAVALEAQLLSTAGYSLLVLIVVLTTAAAPLLGRWILGKPQPT